MEGLLMFKNLIDVLNALTWGADWRHSHMMVEVTLRTMWKDRRELIASLGEYIDGLGIPRITKTAELHSWELHRGESYDVKLNQFVPWKCGDEGRTSEGIHHHTRPLTTLTLSGGYEQIYYEPKKPHDHYEVGESWSEQDMNQRFGPTTKAGLVYTIDPDIFHALTDFRDDTLTLAVYGKIVRPVITVFNTVTRKVERRTTCTHAKQNMLAKLRHLADTN